METKPSIDGTIIESQEFSEVEELLPVVREKMSCVKKENPPRENIKDFLAFNSITLKELADKLNKAYPDSHTSAANISNKMARGTIKFSEVEQMAEVLGYELEFVRKKSEKTQDNMMQVVWHPQIYELENGTVEVDSYNFGKVVIKGNAANEAAWCYLQESLRKICPTRIQEGRIIDKVKKLYNVEIERK